MVKLFAHRRKAKRRHFWVFASETTHIQGRPVSGDTVQVYDNDDYVGNAVYAEHSQVRARIFSRIDVEFGVPVLVERFRTALERRRRQLPDEADFRLVYGESDLLPGIVIDKYDDHFVLQVYAAGMEPHIPEIVTALNEVFAVKSVYAKNDFRLRDIENLPRYERLLAGTVPESVVIRENGAQYDVNIAEGQKSGFYFDQRLTRRRVRELSRDRRVLDAFCYSGGFAVNAALGGAREVTAVDTSEPATALVTRNAALNGVGEKVTAVNADAFELFRRYNHEGRRFDLVVVDPPPFVKRRSELRQGMRAYRDINWQAMKLLSPGGILVSCSCAHHLGWQELYEVLAQAAQGCDREFRICERLGHGPDHPVLLDMPETEYLRCYVLEVA